MKAVRCFLLLFAMEVVWAEELPLANGNQWTYRDSKTGAEMQIRVGTPFVIGGEVYHALDGYAVRRLLVRRNVEGDLVWLDEESRVEKVLTSFARGNGDWMEAPHRDCAHETRRNPEPVEYRGSAGRFPAAVEIEYRSAGCADMRVLSEVFVANVGMVKRVSAGLEGTREYELVYARVGKAELQGAPSASFSVSATTVQERPSMQVTLRFDATNSPAQTMIFPSTQIFEVIVRNERGEEVYRYSDGQAFLPVLTERVFSGRWSQALDVPKPAAGRYTVEGSLATGAAGPKFAATLALVVE